MRLTRHVLVALALAAWAASLAQSDARPRGGKQPNAGRHVGVTAPGGGAVKARGTASPVRREIPAFTTRNPIGATTPPIVSPPAAARGTIPAPSAAGAANAIGVRPGIIGSTPAPAAAAKIGPGATPATGARPTVPAFAAHGGAINGTGITRPGTTPGVIGGPARIAGGVTGTGMKPKR